MTTTMLACGHAANAVDTATGEPSCAMCAGLDDGASEPVAMPDLTGRSARCTCGRTEPSSLDLAFFEFRGEGSPRGIDTCKHCAYALVAHERKAETGEAHLSRVCDNFEPRGPWEFDSFYCGCQGWS